MPTARARDFSQQTITPVRDRPGSSVLVQVVMYGALLQHPGGKRLIIQAGFEAERLGTYHGQHRR